VGATYHRYPIDVVGDTLLRQQALLTIKNLPSMIARLKDDIGELTKARSGMAGMAGIAPPRKKRTPPTIVKSAAAAAAGDALDEFDDALDDFDEEEEQLDEETEKEIKDIERIGKEIERVLLRIGTSHEPLADKDLLALKRLGVVDQGTMAATQGEAKRLATEATNAIKVRVAGLKGAPPKIGALSQKKK
jgi:phosphate uptake regulator